MSVLRIRLPDSLHKQLQQCASAEGTSIEQFINSAVAEKLAALLSPGYLEARAKRASRKRFEAALKSVPEVEPPAFDRLSRPALARTAAHTGKRRKPRKPSGGGC
jgi:predicted transcriptional regulator